MAVLKDLIVNGASRFIGKIYAPGGIEGTASNALKVNNHTVDKDVPSNAVFTDTKDWNSITGKPTFATVATSGSYNDLSNKPTIPSAVTESTVSGWGFTKNTSNLTLGETSTTAYRGDRGKTAYDHSQSTHAPTNAQKNVQSDWNQTTTTADDYIKNKPTIPPEVTESTVAGWGFTKNSGTSSLSLGETSTTAYRGDRGKTAYDHSQSTHAPTNAQKNVQSDWSQTNTSADDYIKNKPTIPSAVTESTVSGWGFTKNAGTVTGVTAGTNMSGGGTSGAVTVNHATPSGAATKSSGFYKFSTDSQGHVNGTTAVTKADITGLGIGAQDLAPLQTKTYTGVYSAADNDANNYKFYGKIVPTGAYTDMWRVKVRLTTSVPSNENYKSSHIVEMYGMRNTYAAYAVWNAIQNTSYRNLWYHTFRFATNETNALSTGHLIGLSLTSTPNRTSSSYQRTYKVEILETEGCTVTLFDTIKIIGEVANSGNYGGNSNFNATDNGLQETGDANTYDRTYLSSIILTNGGSDNLCRYNLFGYDENGRTQPISTYTAGYTSYTTSMSTARSYNTNGWNPSKGLSYIDSNINLAPGVTATSTASVFFAITSADLRYSDNVIYSYNPNTFGLLRGKPIYLRGVIKSDGKFYVAPYPKDAVIVDGYYKSSSTFVTTSGGSTNISSYHSISSNYVYRDITSGKYYKYASSTYTEITDLSPYKNYQKAWTQTIPTSEETDSNNNPYVYMLIGIPYYSSSYPDGGYQYNLLPSHPLYWYKDGAFVEYGAQSGSGGTVNATNTPTKIYLVGATAQSEKPQTFSNNEVYTQDGTLTTKKVRVGGGSATFEYNATLGAVVVNFS